MSSVSHPVSDPRIYFAAERTLLAWVRTGIAVMAFGFVVARFSFVLSLVQGEAGSRGHGISPYLGGALVAIGVLATASGALQYRRFFRTLHPADIPASARPHFVTGLSWALVAVGTALGFVLLV